MRARVLDPDNHLLVTATRFGLFAGGVFFWWLFTTLEWLPPFFFGDPIGVAGRLVTWFVTGSILITWYRGYIVAVQM